MLLVDKLQTRHGWDHTLHLTRHRGQSSPLRGRWGKFRLNCSFSTIVTADVFMLCSWRSWGSLITYFSSMRRISDPVSSLSSGMWRKLRLFEASSTSESSIKVWSSKPSSSSSSRSSSSTAASRSRKHGRGCCGACVNKMLVYQTNFRSKILRVAHREHVCHHKHAFYWPFPPSYPELLTCMLVK